MASILDTIDRPHRGKYRSQRRLTLEERYARNSRRDETTGCLIWTGRVNNAGYGLISVSQAGYPTRTFSAHRAAYEMANGPVPDGLVLDHLCRNRACVEPAHLEPVTVRENTMRSPVAQAALNAAKTHCPQGHPYDEKNTYHSPRGDRGCRTCQRVRKAA